MGGVEREGGVMAIKSDRWIRHMAQEHRMIEPFVASQVKEESSGHTVISYGLSSYGYDIRVADEFKIFTNVRNALVDPKAFNEDSFVDFNGDHCVIPPNSFALARTLEYFRIPRGILTICIGKSTYARCFRGDTRVALADGTAPTLEAMARRAEGGESFFGYSLGAAGEIGVTALKAPRYIGRDALLQVVLDNGAKIDCTPDHPFMTRTGQMVKADDLRPGDTLMPLYRNRSQECERVYQPYTGRLCPVSPLFGGQCGSTTGDAGVSVHSPMRERGDKAVLAQASPTLPIRRTGSLGLNHKITAIREVAGLHDVYCLTVPEVGNFALAAGVFVHNCGIIVNVTPLEPEWEGYITLEFSNTTPLPAKLYANEGVAQVLFLESDELCETSYKDRAGKYQGQDRLTLPRS